MSSWTTLTLRGKESRDYDRARYDEHDRWPATADIVATAEEDDRVREWEVWDSHVYMIVSHTMDYYGWDEGEEIIEDYAEMVDDAVILCANDTSDTGEARYYESPTDTYKDMYAESQTEDGLFVGQKALAVINARHNIIARDLRERIGFLNEEYLDDGVSRL